MYTPQGWSRFVYIPPPAATLARAAPAPVLAFCPPLRARPRTHCMRPAAGAVRAAPRTLHGAHPNADISAAQPGARAAPAAVGARRPPPARRPWPRLAPRSGGRADALHEPIEGAATSHTLAKPARQRPATPEASLSLGCPPAPFQVVAGPKPLPTSKPYPPAPARARRRAAGGGRRGSGKRPVERDPRVRALRCQDARAGGGQEGH